VAWSQWAENGVDEKKDCLLSKSPLGVVMTETTSGDPRQQFFFCVVLTGQWIAVGETLYTIVQAFLNSLIVLIMGSRLGFVVVLVTNFDSRHFIE
jgi:hypothetical protein